MLWIQQHSVLQDVYQLIREHQEDHRYRDRLWDQRILKSKPFGDNQEAFIQKYLECLGIHYCLKNKA